MRNSFLMKLRLFKMQNKIRIYQIKILNKIHLVKIFKKLLSFNNYRKGGIKMIQRLKKEVITKL